MVKEKIEKRRTRAYTRAREKGLFFRVHPTFGVMGAEKKKSTEQIVDFPVSSKHCCELDQTTKLPERIADIIQRISALIWNKEKPGRFQLSLWKICKVSWKSLIYNLSPDI